MRRKPEPEQNRGVLPEGGGWSKRPLGSACSSAADLRTVPMVMVCHDNGMIKDNSFKSVETVNLDLEVT